MDYKKLAIISYTDINGVEEEFQKRLNSYSTLKTGFFIHPMVNEFRKTDIEYELFYNMIPSHVKKIEKIIDNSKRISGLSELINDIAREKIMLNYLVEEIQGTNETEGVRSTRKEISNALSHKDSDENVRFKGIANMYFKIFSNNLHEINSVSDVREIYDLLFIEGVPEEDKPDGKFFRKGTVEIMDGPTVVHRGNPDEASIIEGISYLIKLMHDTDIPYIVKAIICHYILEYIHPFYDGNGRLGRFIFSQYVAQKLDFFTGISISNVVNKNKNKYSDVFSEVSKKKNYGELTFFVEGILDLILIAQQTVLEDLENNIEKIQYYKELLDNLDLSSSAKNVLFILLQDYEFKKMGSFVTDIEVAEAIGKSRSAVNKPFGELLQQGIVDRVGKRPSIHRLSNEFVEKNL